jgi:hypothetical protein
MCALGKVKHVGAACVALEDEMCNFGLTGLSSGASPDRLDALVWAVTELVERGRRQGPKVRSLGGGAPLVPRGISGSRYSISTIRKNRWLRSFLFLAGWWSSSPLPRTTSRRCPSGSRMFSASPFFQAELGEKHADAKPLKGFGGAAVLEVVENYDGNTYRAVYTVKSRASSMFSTSSRRSRRKARQRRCKTWTASSPD